MAATSPPLPQGRLGNQFNLPTKPANYTHRLPSASAHTHVHAHAHTHTRTCARVDPCGAAGPPQQGHTPCSLALRGANQHLPSLLVCFQPFPPPKLLCLLEGPASGPSPCPLYSEWSVTAGHTGSSAPHQPPPALHGGPSSACSRRSDGAQVEKGKEAGASRRERRAHSRMVEII